MRKAIIFDLDDTLLWDKKSIEESFKDTCKLASKANTKIDPIILEERVKEKARRLYASYPTYSFTRMIGINPFEGLWGDFFDKGEVFEQLHKLAPDYRKSTWTEALREVSVDDPYLGAELAEAFPRIRKEKAYVYKDTFDVLDQLASEFTLLLLTNGSPDLQETKLDLTPRLRSYFDAIIISGAFGKGKPDASIFQHALDILEVEKDKVIMVGDNLNTDILGASRIGIDSIWINREDIENNGLPTFEVKDLSSVLALIRKGV
ncbi:MAG: HAD family hydrolase [Bacillota bacterium]|uniref:Phosphoserine phosphatase n=1 Tax=Virgibacillus salarius TaxID=447199 RepID=A0A941DW74_9BACI|nr:MULTISPECIES: HAD family hydrolase [Bacillaceae]NAZ07340.1 HAD-IA family hydrolase [Agaribacter marinus]MBR7794618.1 HAD family hydrolase [Virgibacillus salarius]MCC2250910.1 HAD family hydrolase [Virgibacillus sp. AGTR]MDY7044754.1 HAD family hydrolase [Virgibacillus sp. M23]QRZ16360.1 HAD family hydrolase [Virgibacillus sp. AGTR]